MSGKIIDKDFKTVYENEIKTIGMPRCRECGKELEEGDTVDNYWPYFLQFNLCKKCRREDRRSKRKQQWEQEMKEAKPTEHHVEMWFARELVEKLRNEITQGGQNIPLDSPNQYARGYWDGLVHGTMSLIARSPITKQAWQAAGLTFEEMEMCRLEIEG